MADRTDATRRAKLTLVAPSKRRWLTIAGVVVGVILAGVVVGPFVYIHFFSGSTPAKLTIDNGSSGTSTTAGAETTPLTGTWKVVSPSTAGYRVEEVLFGQSTTAVGRTTAVTGQMAIVGTTISTASFSVDMTKVTSDKSQRDEQFQGRIMETAQFPTATFRLTKPIVLGTPPPNGKIITVPATGQLTLHGQTKTVTVPLQARRSGNTITVNGSIPVKFSDYGIANPSASFVTTQDHGLVEFLLQFAHP